MGRVLRARYFSDGNILTAVQRRKASYAWKSILYGRDLVKQGMRYVIGDGTLINAWTDPWLPDHPPRSPQSLTRVNHVGKVNMFFTEGNREWDLQKLRMAL